MTTRSPFVENVADNKRLPLPLTTANWLPAMPQKRAERVALTSNLAAQEPTPTPPNPTLACHYEILDENGDPVEEGHVWKETIIQPCPFVPCYVSVVARDNEVQEDQSCNYTPDSSGGYDFTNSAGRTGVLTPMATVGSP